MLLKVSIQATVYIPNLKKKKEKGDPHDTVFCKIQYACI